MKTVDFTHLPLATGDIVLDLGCGQGRHVISAYVEANVHSVGVDLSLEDLKTTRERFASFAEPDNAAKSFGLSSASALDLPFADSTFDKIICSEVLEHLPEDTLTRAVSELRRVASRYIFVTVPFRENLLRRVARCPSCKLAFHVDGHLHSFDAAALDRLFGGFSRVSTWLGGPAEASTYPSLEVLRRTVAGRDWVWKGSVLRCPRCGEERFSPSKRGFLRRSADRAIDRATSALNAWTGRGDSPYWLLAVYARSEAT